MQRKSKIEYFNDKVIVAESGCHEWTGRLNAKGYGVFRGENSTWQAHRWIYKHTHGSISDGLYILHKCDNRKCVNPDHLYAGTQKDNMRDMWDKGRGYKPKGSKHFRSVFTEDDISRIRGLSAIGLKPKLITKIFNSKLGTITSIVRGVTWTHVPTPEVIGRRTFDSTYVTSSFTSRRPINMLSAEGYFLRKFKSITEASQHINRCATGFREVIKGRQSTWGGFKWEYAN